MHNIEQTDIILVEEGKENKTWHGLETVVSHLDHESAAPVHFPIKEEDVMIGGVVSNEWKAIAADTSNRDDIEENLIPLHISKKGYQIIDNRAVYDSIMNTLDGIDFKISCIGTLNNLRKYFVSVKLKQAGEFNVNGDDFQLFLNFATSHDGTMALNMHISTVRVVCDNTLRFSVGNASDSVKIYHTKNASSRISQGEKILNSILLQNEQIMKTFEELERIKYSHGDIEKIVAGYFLADRFKKPRKVNSEFKFSTRTLNAIDSISSLAIRGRGNKGETAYDVLNGATEYWTSGNGTGKTTSRADKVYSSEFGGGSRSKKKFLSYLQSFGASGMFIEDAEMVLSNS